METVECTVENLSVALFTVNRHAKTALNPSYLYLLKRKTIEKMLEEGKAKKVGLHFSRNPKYSQQKSDVLVAIGAYYFHIPPTKEDFKHLPHLGTLDDSYRNPAAKMPLSQAKRLLQAYTGISPEDVQPKPKRYDPFRTHRFGKTFR